ncbi:aldose epimerase family protein [Compostibacter hankyongensis]|uniref:Aldose 1-epimerase n=1 Tax=Compostibacter hankyongensis TaxID=1007089 RepID=A0ABP8FCN5_9BACT
MQIDQQPFGQTGSGAPVTRYTLENKNGMKAGILDYGGIVQSLTAPDRSGGWADVVLGFPELDGYLTEAYLEGGPYFGAIVGRFANRIAGGQFSLDGKVYPLYINNGGNALHGGKVGFDKKIWKAVTRESDREAVLELSYLSPDGEEGYPGNLEVTVTYTLNNENALRIDYRAVTDQKTVINLTNHAYFNLSGGEDTVLHEMLTVDADRFLPIRPDQIPTGEIRSVAGTPMDLRQPAMLGAQMLEPDEQLGLGHGYDHCWALNVPGDLSRLAAAVYDPHSGRQLEVFTTEPGIQLYAGNFLDGSLRGKRGESYGPHAGLALETQHFPDSPNRPEFPSTVLAPGREWRSTTVYRFSVR